MGGWRLVVGFFLAAAATLTTTAAFDDDDDDGSWLPTLYTVKNYSGLIA